AQPQRKRTICELRLRKCLQFCSWNATNNPSQNERWIGMCISSPDPISTLDKVHELLMQRLWSVALEVRKTVSAEQYQCLTTQYQSGPSCAEPSPPRATTTFGWVGAQTTRRAPVRAAHDVERRLAIVHVRPRSRAHVLAVVATHRTRAGATVVRRPRRPRRARAAGRVGGRGPRLRRLAFPLACRADRARDAGALGCGRLGPPRSRDRGHGDADASREQGALRQPHRART